MSPNAAPRPRSHRRGGNHLTLVTNETLAALATAADDQRTTGAHAAPAPRVMVAGSSTMRALIALGALLSAIGFSIGKAEALLAHEGSDNPAEAEPDVAVPPAGEAPAKPVEKAPAATKTPAKTAPAVKTAAKTTAAAKVTAAVSRTAPGQWAPAVEPVEAHTYTLAAPAPTGRHRGEAASDRHEWGHAHDRPTGRHRRTTQHGAKHKPKSRHDGTTRPAGKARPTVTTPAATGHDSLCV
jgi:hypothetical protein